MALELNASVRIVLGNDPKQVAEVSTAWAQFLDAVKSHKPDTTFTIQAKASTSRRPYKRKPRLVQPTPDAA